MECVEYDHDTGRILCQYTVSYDVYEYMKSQGKYLIEGSADPNKSYVDISVNPPAIAVRPAQSTTQDKAEIQANGVDFMTLESLPVPCEVSVGDKNYAVDDGILEWGTLERGTYPILAKAFPYRDWEGTVNAT